MASQAQIDANSQERWRERHERARHEKRRKSKPMTMRRKPKSPRRIKPSIPLLGSKNEAKCKRKILLATDETRIEHG
jgi:hypothetical protein